MKNANYETIKLRHANYGIKHLDSESNYDRIISIGDIHGCYDQIKYHIDNLKPTPNDLLIFLGDYIDRGADSPSTIEFLIGLKKEFNCIFLRGNHDSMFLSYFGLGGIFGRYFLDSCNGGDTTISQYQARNDFDLIYSSDNELINKASKYLIDAKIPQSHVEFLLDTKMYLEMDNFFYSHAGFKVWLNEYDRQDEESYIWTREDFLGRPHDKLLNKIVVHGHTINYGNFMPSWDIELKKINLDSGSFLSGNISSLTVTPKDYTKCFMSVSNYTENYFENATGAKA